MIWEVPGVSVGHWSDHTARTGCTAVLFDPPVIASGEVRGAAPATREFALLDPMASVQRIDAVVLSGGSAFGLAAAQGVMEWCEAHDRGFPTPAGRVPIVVGMSLFDLAVGDASVRPDAGSGRAACDAAPQELLGAVGAGTGCTIGNWRGPEVTLDGGLVGAVQRRDDLVVAALVAVNPWGDVVGTGSHHLPHPELPHPEVPLVGDGAGAGGTDVGTSGAGSDVHDPAGTNTTIGVVVTNAVLDKVGCHHVARAAHDGLARAITPPHSSVDGDAFVAAATCEVMAHPDQVRLLALTAVDRAIRSLGSDR
jgi:L-aminopeptidase/D-esterase-like protein